MDDFDLNYFNNYVRNYFTRERLDSKNLFLIDENRLTVMDFNEGKRFFEFYKNESQMKEDIKYPIEGYNDFQNHLDNIGFYNDKKNKNPILEFISSNKENDLNFPRLDSIIHDERMIIKPILKYGKSYILRILGRGTNTITEFNHEYKINLSTNNRRGIGVDFFKKSQRGKKYEALINIARYPIILNNGLNVKETDYSNLAFQVFQNQLEPYTSIRIIKDWMKIESDEEEIFQSIKSNRRYEEELISNAIIREWLFSRMIEKKFKMNKIIDNYPIELDEYHAKKSFETVINKGSKNTIDFYISKNWNLDDFLSSDY